MRVSLKSHDGYGTNEFLIVVREKEIVFTTIDGKEIANLVTTKMTNDNRITNNFFLSFDSLSCGAAEDCAIAIVDNG